MIDGVFIPRGIAVRLTKFVNAAAGEGICFDFDGAEEIMFDWFRQEGDTFPIWVPKEIRDEWY